MSLEFLKITEAICDLKVITAEFMANKCSLSKVEKAEQKCLDLIQQVLEDKDKTIERLRKISIMEHELRSRGLLS